jgi:hypothetical protein
MKKHTKSDSGKLGATKSKLIAVEKLQQRIIAYNLNAKKCAQCSSDLEYHQRHQKFCNASCAATFNNFRRGARKSVTAENLILDSKDSSGVYVVWECLHCKKQKRSARYRIGKYCSNRCQVDYTFKQAIENWGTKAPRTAAIKRYLTELYGYKCAVCGISEYNGKPIVLELEHKDGNSSNNDKENLCLICPNCHSQTPTYKAKNRGNGRHSRRIRYAEGKSF